MDILRRKLEIVAGVRYDHIYNMDGGVAPRINASYDLIPEKLSVRGGYGITYKAPSLGYLYPDNAYFDILNFDNTTASGFSDAQKFQIATTHVYSAENPDLELAKTTKWEVGVDFKIGQVRGSVTYYEDKTRNGYMTSATFDTFKCVDYNQYSAAKPANETDMPELSLKSSDKILLQYSIPTNYFAYNSRGVEFDIDFGRINSIRTSFGLNGSWTQYQIVEELLHVHEPYDRQQRSRFLSPHGRLRTGQQGGAFVVNDDQPAYHAQHSANRFRRHADSQRQMEGA